MRVKYIAILAIAAVVLAVATPATAQKAKAKKAFDDGVAALDNHDYKGALELFKEAYEAAPHWMVLFHMGNCYVKLGQPAKAIAAYEQFLKDGGGDISVKDRKAAEEELRNQRGKVGTLILFVKPKGTEVRIDGESIGESPFEELLLKAGPHFILAIREDGEEELEVEIEAGEEITARMYPDQEATTEVTGKARPTPRKKPEPVDDDDDDEPAPAPLPAEQPDKDGVLSVSANVDGAEVVLDGDAAGETPFEETMAAGTYKLSVEADGYMPYSTSARVRGGMVNQYDVSLVGEDEQPDPLSTPFFVAVGVAGAGLIMGGVSWGAFGYYKGKVSDYQTALDSVTVDLNYSDDCQGQMLTPGSPEEYWCQNEWYRRDYDGKSKPALAFGIVGTSMFVLGGAAAALFYFKPDLFFGASSDAELMVTPIATADGTGLMLNAAF